MLGFTSSACNATEDVHCARHFLSNCWWLIVDDIFPSCGLLLYLSVAFHYYDLCSNNTSRLCCNLVLGNWSVIPSTIVLWCIGLNVWLIENICSKLPAYTPVLNFVKLIVKYLLDWWIKMQKNGYLKLVD